MSDDSRVNETVCGEIQDYDYIRAVRRFQKFVNFHAKLFDKAIKSGQKRYEIELDWLYAPITFPIENLRQEMTQRFEEYNPRVEFDFGDPEVFSDKYWIVISVTN